MTNRLIKIKSLLLFSFCLIQFAGICQTTNKEKIKEVVNELINNLQRCDTSALLEMYDTGFSHINKKNYRDFIRQGIVQNCKTFKDITNRHNLPDLNNLTFLIDSTNGSNIAVLPLLNTNDSLLNFKKCSLFVMFYPDRFFLISDKLLRFTIVAEELIPRNRDIIKPIPLIQGNKNN